MERHPDGVPARAPEPELMAAVGQRLRSRRCGALVSKRWQTDVMSSTDAGDLSLDQLVELQRRLDAGGGDDGRDGVPRYGGGSGDGDGDHGDDPDAVVGSSGTDDVVVLPWYQHPMNIMTLVVTAAIMAGMIGWMVGDSRSELQHNEVDTGFLHDMREHHEQAVQMSFIFRTRPDTDPGLRTIARSIIVGQSLEVGRMIQFLQSFGETEARDSEVSMLWMGMSAAPGQMPGMASQDELEQLGLAEGREADELFVRLMVEHHIGGVEMAEFAAENGENDRVTRMAAGMAAAQRDEILEITGQLADDPGET